MLMRLFAAAALAALSLSMPVSGAECAAARSLVDGEEARQKRRNHLEFEQWLVMQFISTDQAPASRELFEKETASAAARSRRLSELLVDVASLSAAAAQTIEDGTPDCEFALRTQASFDGLLDTRAKQLEEYRTRRFPFINGCELVALNALTLGTVAQQKGTNPNAAERARMAKRSAAIVKKTGARLAVADLDRFIDVGLKPSRLPYRTRYAHLSLWCLRHYQGVALEPLELTAKVGRCVDLEWPDLAPCIDSAIRPPS